MLSFKIYTFITCRGIWTLFKNQNDQAKSTKGKHTG